MRFLAIIDDRRSVRRFAPDPLPADALQTILHTAQRAPSAGDLQAYCIVVAQSPQTRTRLAAAAHGQDFLAEAAVVLVFLADEGRSRRKYGARGAGLFCIQDATIAAAYAQLAASALGLGCCWVGAFDDVDVSKVLSVPAGMRPIAMLAVGYPAEKPDATPRRAIADLVHRERF